ncbi:hypothetical protein SDC9_174286 [bioreactor metagenome]|uniref:Uncharacterized protein n=1 Tax=bioreactor metagenome TaxID=1076179 RepID=A0A645GL36_9ZZZZ
MRLMLGKQVTALALPLAGGRVDGQHEIIIGLVSGLFDSFEQIEDGLLIAVKIGRKTALVTHGGGKPILFEQGSQCMKHFRTPAQPLGEAGRAHGHDHKLLDINVVGRVGAAVQYVHHGYGQRIRPGAAQEFEQRDIQRTGRGPGAGQGNGQDGIGPQA